MKKYVTTNKFPMRDVNINVFEWGNPHRYHVGEFENGNTVNISKAIFKWMLERGYAEEVKEEPVFTKEQVEYLKDSMIKNMLEYYGADDCCPHGYVNNKLNNLKISEP